MDRRLVRARAGCESTKPVLRSGQGARGAAETSYDPRRPTSDSAQSAQRSARTFAPPTIAAVIARPARHAQQVDSSTSHIGFRCVIRTGSETCPTAATGEKSGLEAHALNRRNILLGAPRLRPFLHSVRPRPVQVAQALQPAASGRPPNILVIMGDDVGWFNIGAYHQGIMSGRRQSRQASPPKACALPTIRRGKLHRRARQLHHRTDSAAHRHDDGRPSRRRRRHPRPSRTLATVLKSLGYATGQFGKNHLGDLNKFLPTVHGFR